MAKAQALSPPKPEPQMLYNMRCTPCSDGHRLCSREVPCKTCTGSRRAVDCQYPAKAKLVAVEPDESEQEEEEDDDDYGYDKITFRKGQEKRQHGGDGRMKVCARILS
jgi:hypothetical protein